MKESTITHSQTKEFAARPVTGYGDGATLAVEIRYDDECKNGHNTFAITGEVKTARGHWLASGCLHDDIARVFPELAHLIKWHLVSSDTPMHYFQNVIFLAGDRDCWGRSKGQPSAWSMRVKFENSPIEWTTRSTAFLAWLTEARGSDFEVIEIQHPRDPKTFGAKYTLGGAPDRWHECPFDTERDALQFLEAMRQGYKVVTVPTAYSEGKARELDAARRAAIWPDATDEDLTAPGLEDRLRARLPGLMAAFRADIEALGFTW